MITNTDDDDDDDNNNNNNNKQDIKKLKQTAILRTAHILREVLIGSAKHSTWEITLRVTLIVTIEQLQHHIPYKHGLFQVTVNTLPKDDNK